MKNVNQPNHHLKRDQLVVKINDEYRPATNEHEYLVAVAIVASVEDADNFTLLKEGAHTFSRKTVCEDNLFLSKGWYILGTKGRLEEPSDKARFLPDIYQACVYMESGTQGLLRLSQAMDMAGV